MTARAALDAVERRRRLAVRHLLAPSRRVDAVAATAAAVIGLHASDPLSVVLSALARLRDPDLAAVESALYEDRTLVRILGMRRTMFTVPVDDAALVQRAAGDAVAATERARVRQVLDQLDVGDDPDGWLAEVGDATVAAVAAHGPLTTTELREVVPALEGRLTMGAGTSWPADVGVASRVAFLLGAEGRLVRARPSGRWTSAVHRWATTEDWLGAPFRAIPVEVARVELVRRWLDRFGPGTEADVAWWTGWPLRAVRSAVEAIGVVEVDLVDGTDAPGWVLPGDEDPTPEPEPWAALLPALDPTTMGWKERSWYVGPHQPDLFDRSNNAGATVWVDGRIVGGWARRADGTVVTRLLDDVGRERNALVEAEAARWESLLVDLPVKPRFPAPLDKALQT